jgi:hypothetical protein
VSKRPSVLDREQPASTRIDRGWLMRHPGALADDALVRMANPLRQRRFPRPRPLHFRRPTRLIRAPAI